MAINVISKPQPFSFSGNQIVFSLSSDDYLATAGSVFIGKIAKTEKWYPGRTFNFQFGDERVVMTVVEFPDDSGTQIAADNHFLTIEDMADAFRGNYALNKYYNIYVDGTDIVFEARDKGSFYNWKPSPGLSITNSGIDQKERSGFKFLFEVFLENESGTSFSNIYSEHLNPDIPFSGILNIDLKSIINAALTNDIPNIPLPSLCKKSKRRFFCRYAEVYNNTIHRVRETEKFHVAKGGFSYVGFKTKAILSMLRPDPEDRAKDLFLKQGSKTIKTRTNQPEFLFFVNFRENTSIRLKTTIEFSDNSATAIQFSSPLTLDLYDKAYWPTGFETLNLNIFDKQIKRYKCCLVNSSDQNISEEIKYVVDYEYREKVRYFTYLSSLGSFDTFTAYGKGSEEYDLAQENAIKPIKIGYKLSDGNKTNYDLKLTRNFTVNTGVLDKRHFDLLADFYLSTDKFLYKNGKSLPITVTNKKAGTGKDQVTRYAQDITYTFNFEDDKYTEGDVEDPGQYIDGFFFGNSVTNPPKVSCTIPGYILSITPQQIANWNDLYEAYLNGNLSGGGSSSWGNISGLIDNQHDLIEKLSTKHPLEDQRLSRTSIVTFKGAILDNFLTIPTTDLDPADMEPGRYYMRVRDAEIGGRTPVPVIARLGDLLDVDTSGDAEWVLYKKNNGTFGFKAASGGPGPDVYSKSEINAFFGGVSPITGYNKGNWDAAYSWGNHASAGYALANGSNASGAWNISVSKWGGITADFLTPGTSLSYLLGLDNTDKAKYFSSAYVKAFVGLNNGSTLINNINGSASQWGGVLMDTSSEGTISELTRLIGYYYDPATTQTKGRVFQSSVVKQWLGLPASGGYDLQSVTDRGMTTTNSIVVGPTFSILGNNPYIQWVNSSNSRLGYIQHNNSNLYYVTDVGSHIFFGATYFNSPVNFNRVGENIKLGGTGVADIFIGQAGDGSFHLGDWAIGAHRIVLNPLNGNVGIGTLNPVQKFVVSSGGALGFEVYDDSANNKFGLQVFNRATTQYGELQLDALNISLSPKTGQIRVISSDDSVGIALMNFNGSYKGSVYADQYGNIGFLTTSAGWRLRVENNGYVHASSYVAYDDWFRSSGNVGWYNNTYDGGIYMTDNTYVRVYGGKTFYAEKALFGQKMTAKHVEATTALRVPKVELDAADMVPGEYYLKIREL